ncbi:dCTP deaminase [Pandoravirus quercus]|uniref:dUTP diphosphatase n=2 Tax=Pandoravirus TaxID=2060084 RepID=A0A2U7UAF3_9VIRU|nr:dCTP deaminase [Pandoravirus quercus]AVK75409.1 Deoxyuridine 5'-triphosphate nucleotidohydrolase [Pandoravirus quercus]QBZ81589.1 Trimeric dUTPase domain containing protein [Pandoravirus celtis]
MATASSLLPLSAPGESGTTFTDNLSVAATPQVFPLDHATHDEASDTVPAVTGERKRPRPESTDDDDAGGNPTVFKCKRMHDDAKLPRRGTSGAAGYDLWAIETTTVPARGRAQVPIGLSIAIPAGYYGRVAPRSSMARDGIDVGAGVLDADYRGEVGVMLFNHTDADYVIDGGARIAQLLIEKIAHPEPVWVDSLDDTERGTGGFGSTGR